MAAKGVTNAELRAEMQAMLAEIKAIPRIDPDRMTRMEGQIDLIRADIGGFRKDFVAVCHRVEELEGQRREANGTHATLDKRMTLLERSEQGNDVNWGRVWAVVQAVILAVLTAVVTGLWKP